MFIVATLKQKSGQLQLYINLFPISLKLNITALILERKTEVEDLV